MPGGDAGAEDPTDTFSSARLGREGRRGVSSPRGRAGAVQAGDLGPAHGGAPAAAGQPHGVAGPESPRNHQRVPCCG